MDRYTGILGILAVLAVCWLGSTDRASIRWRTVVWGLTLQFLFAFIVLRIIHDPSPKKLNLESARFSARPLLKKLIIRFMRVSP